MTTVASDRGPLSYNLLLVVMSNVVKAAFVGETNSALVTYNFSYTVEANKNGTIIVTGIDLNGGNIEDGAGNVLRQCRNRI